jgi:hypothetical protein
MKTLTILLVLTFIVMFSSTSFAEWKKIGTSVDGDTFYVDFESIRKHDGYVYWWGLTDYLKPSKSGVFSAKTYLQGECKLFRVKDLSFSSHKEPMGGGTGVSITPPDNWNYPPPLRGYVSNYLRRAGA